MTEIRASTGRTERVARLYALALIAAFAAVPIGPILYLDRFQTPSLLFMDHTFHLIAIAVATIEGLFVSYVSWRCYRISGEPFMRWLTLGFVGFTVIYAPHGFFTPLAHRNPWLFILYGPVSRLAMATCLLVAILVHGRAADRPEVRAASRPWWVWLAAFLAIDVAVALLAISPVASAPPVRLTLEGGAMCLSALCAVVVVVRRIGAPAMRLYVIATLLFSQSSLAFLLGKVWNHQWWLAHVIFASGFFLLSYGVIRAFLTTGALSTADASQPPGDRDLRGPGPSTMLSRS